MKTMRRGSLLTVVLSLLIPVGACAVCDGWVENRAVMKRYAPEEPYLSPELVRANIEATDYTAIVIILRGKVKEKAFLRKLGGGYVNHVYQARVMETIRGPRYDAIMFSVMAESDMEPFLPEYPVIVSLCGKGSDAMYVPDNGYEIPATATLAAAARSAARRLKKSVPSRSVCAE